MSAQQRGAALIGAGSHGAISSGEPLNGTPLNGSALDGLVCFALYSSMQATLQLYRDLLAPWGLTYQQFLVLMVLWERGESAPSIIADALTLDRSTISGLLGRMERDGLLTRSREPGNQRAVVVALTERGDELRHSLKDVLACVAGAMSIDLEGAQALIGSLRKVRDAVNTASREEIAAAQSVATN